jgi:hypothetical protein
MLCTYALDIHAPIERAFECVNDQDKLKEWMQGLEETVYVGAHDPDHPVGSRFRQRIREGGKPKEYEGEVTDYDKPRHLGVRIFCPQFTVMVHYRFSSTSSTSTRLDYQAEITPQGFMMRVMMVCFGWLAKGVLKKQMQKLKELAERQTV